MNPALFPKSVFYFKLYGSSSRACTVAGSSSASEASCDHESCCMSVTICPLIHELSGVDFGLDSETPSSAVAEN